MSLRRKYNGAKHTAEVVGYMLFWHISVEERSVEIQAVLKGAVKADRSDYADMSSDKTGEKPVRRKTKVS